jgi:hypothetical protein
MLNFFLKNKYILILLLIAIFSHLQWFNPFSILTFSDWNYWPDDAVRQLWYGWGTWLSINDLGSVNIQIYFLFFDLIWSFLTNLHLSFDIAVKVTFLVPISIFGFLSPYIFVKKVTCDNFISFVCALFYGSVISFIVSQSSHLPIAFVYSLAPMLFSLFIVALERNDLKHWLYFVLLSFVGVCYEVRIMYIVFFIFLLYFIFFYIKSIQKYIKTLMLPIAIVILLNIFWVIPSVFAGAQAIQQVANRGLFGSLLFSLPHAFTISDSAWTGGYPNVSFVPQAVMNYLWALPLMIFTTLLFKNNRNKKYILFFASISLLGIFLTKQTSQPFTSTYQWLYSHFPGFNLFREASKFYTVTALGYLGLLAYLLLYLKISKNAFSAKYLYIGFSVVIIFISAINLKPLITTEFGTLFVDRHIAQDYLILKDFISSQPEYFRTLYIPRNSSFGFFTDVHPRVSDVDAIQSSLFPLLNSDANFQNLNSQDQILDVVQQSFSKSLLDISSIKYVIIPLQDKGNDNDFFQFYGGQTDPYIRQWYIDQLDKVSWLKKIDIGTSNLVVYENQTYKPPIFAFTNLYNFPSIANLNQKYQLSNSQLHRDFYFNVGASTSTIPETTISDIFENIVSQDVSAPFNTINSATSTLPGTNTLYISDNKISINAILSGSKLSLVKTSSPLYLNGGLHTGLSSQFLQTIMIRSSSQYYAQLNGGLFMLTTGQNNLGRIDVSTTAEIYSSGANVVTNGSFDTGLWQSKVGDCNAYDNNAIIGMKIDTGFASNSDKFIELDATAHIACTSKNIPVASGYYVFSFDYQSPNTNSASYYISFNDPAKTIISNSIAISGTLWQHYSTGITVPVGATSANLTVYARSSDGKTQIINDYDNFKLQKLNLVNTYTIPVVTNYTSSSLLLVDGTNTFSYKDSSYSLQNILPNGSFESGLWQSQVGDCNNYDNNGLVVMILDTHEASDGYNSLELDATRHAACTGESVPARGNQSYLVSFDYESPNTQNASYNIGFNDRNSTSYKADIPIADNKWHTFSKIVTAPADATSLSINLYAKESDGTTNNIDRYDNVKIIQMPNLASTYYLVSDPGVTFEQPASTTFTIISPTKKLVHITGASTPFFLAFSESFDPHWQVELNNSKVQGMGAISPFAKPDVVPNANHFKLDDFLNGWYINPVALCGVSGDLKSGCTLNPDGSYNIEMVIEFEPQRWFYLGLIISGLTLVACVETLIILGLRRIRQSRTRSTSLRSVGTPPLNHVGQAGKGKLTPQKTLPKNLSKTLPEQSTLLPSHRGLTSRLNLKVKPRREKNPRNPNDKT